ncbi:unnamed protein product [Trichogramma brassicae]|uniref:CCHC-type domain-containing protein n=1 Tax=Trichogramma brassicae TaxID=86971 RepID=A0A6H5IAI4_9HYME|nr:unnamed protein product [Trichogramma brassicae]
MEFPRSKSGCKYLLVFQDLFTRYVELKPLRQANGKAVANALEELILFRIPRMRPWRRSLAGPSCRCAHPEQAPLPQHDQPPRRQLLSPPRATQQSDQQAVQPEKTVRQTAPVRTTSARPINGNVERELREATNALTQAKAWAEAADAAAWRKQREAEKAMKDAKEAAAIARRAALIAAEATEQARLAAAEADEAEKAVTEAVNRRRYAERQALTGQRVVLGCLFQDVKLIRTDDSIDPQARTCFNCWQDDHERINCRKKQTRDFCYNCGRVGVQMPDCPRCGEGYVRWLARHPEKRASATKPSQAPKPEIRRPGPKVHVPPKAFLDRYPDEPERNHYDRIRNALKGVEMLTQVRILKEYFPNGAPTSKAKRFDPTTQNSRKVYTVTYTSQASCTSRLNVKCKQTILLLLQLLVHLNKNLSNKSTSVRISRCQYMLKRLIKMFIFNCTSTLNSAHRGFMKFTKITSQTLILSTLY